MNQGPTFRPLILQAVFLELTQILHGVRGLYGDKHDRARFFEIIYFAPKMGKMDQKIGFFEFIKKFGHQFLQNSVYNESLYLLYSSKNPIFGKSLDPEIWVKMLLDDQIAGFLNQARLQNKMKEQSDFCLFKLKVYIKLLGLVWPLWSPNSKIGCISRT